jgi:hypothetical protein
MSQAKTKSMLAGEYARSGLKRGLEFAAKLGVNPYKFGQIGSTDSHTSMPAVEEENFFGKHSGVEPSAKRAAHVTLGGKEGKIYGWQMASSGYAAVWATENTRAAIWDAMHRRETYATTGSRMLVRFFGGWDFVPEDAQSRLPAGVGYAKGVPMGGDLRRATGKATTFLVAALKDSMSGNLDRIQIVKGWVGKDGKAKERIYDVAVSDGRKIGADGRCRTPVGNTVDVEKAIWTNAIGDPELITVWTDPEFDAGAHAFYYARVIEIPTPRWTAYEALRFGIKMPEGCPMTTEEIRRRSGTRRPSRCPAGLLRDPRVAPEALVDVVVDFLQHLPVYDATGEHRLGERRSLELLVGRDQRNRGGLRPDRFLDRGHPHPDLLLRDVEDHVVGRKRERTVVGAADFAQHRRCGVEVVEEVIRHGHARLGVGHYLAELRR